MATPLTAREMKARQLVLAKGTLDAWASKFQLYQTTTSSCQCPDALYRHVLCKHSIALRLLKTRESGET